MFLIMKAAGRVPPPETEAPSHTDLMVSPEDLDAFLEDNPEPPEVVEAEAETVPDAPEPDLRLGLADRLDEARRYAELGKSMRLIDPERTHEAHLVGPDLSDPHTWRHTLLVDDEPFSDAEFDQAEDAFLSALQSGALPVPEATEPGQAWDLDEPLSFEH
jgi:hypothetical protein